jgi:general stress protein YciG
MPYQYKKRGFGSMDKEKLRRVQSTGGKAAHAMGKAHTWSPEEAKKAGRKGGLKLKGSKWSRL